DQRVGAGAIGAPKDGPEVTRLLDSFDDHEQWIRGQPEVVQAEPWDADDRDQAIRPVPEGELRERRLGRGRRRDVASTEDVQGRPRILAAEQGFAHERLDDLEA